MLKLDLLFLPTLAPPGAIWREAPEWRRKATGLAHFAKAHVIASPHSTESNQNCLVTKK